MAARLNQTRQEVELLRQQYRAAQQSYERQARSCAPPCTTLSCLASCNACIYHHIAASMCLPRN